MTKQLIAFLFLFGIFFQSNSQPPKAELEQGKNGQNAFPLSQVNWWRGNLNSSDNHYTEDQSIPYRTIIDRMPLGCPFKIQIGFSVVKSGQFLIDYLTSYDYSGSHQSFFGHTPELVNPVFGLGINSNPSLFPLPSPGSLNSPVFGQPQISFNSLPQNNRLISCWNGNITSVQFLFAPDYDLSRTQTDAILEVTIIATQLPVVLAWGGHLASRLDWGFNQGGIPLTNNEFGCPPCRMRLKGMVKCVNLLSSALLSPPNEDFIQIGNQERTYMSGGKPINPIGKPIMEIIPKHELIDSLKEIKVYPNPSKGNILIMFPSTITEVDMKLFDMNGKIIQKWLGVRSKQIELKNLSKGIYVLRVRSKTETEEKNIKIVVQ